MGDPQIAISLTNVQGVLPSHLQNVVTNLVISHLMDEALHGIEEPWKYLKSNILSTIRWFANIKAIAKRTALFSYSKQLHKALPRSGNELLRFVNTNWLRNRSGLYSANAINIDVILSVIW